MVSDEQLCVIFAASLNLPEGLIYNPGKISSYSLLSSGYHYNFFYTLTDLFSLYHLVTRTLLLSTGSKDKTTSTYTTRTRRPEIFISFES